MTNAKARAKLHDLIESLPSEDVLTALRVLEALHLSSDAVSSVVRDVPIDDELETEQERASVAEARRDLEEGRVIPHDEVMRKYGL